jgi:cardiolipin synthase A/B
VRPQGRVDTTDSGARAGVVGSGTGSGATVSRVVPTLVQKGAAPLQTHEHAIAAAASGALLGASLVGARFPRLVAWPLTAIGAFLGGLGVLRAVQPTLSESEPERPESGVS